MNINKNVSDNTILTKKEQMLAIGVVLLGLFMSVLDTVIVSIALPSITSYFGNTISESQWIVTAYLLTITALLMFFGKLSAYTGLKKMFLGGVALFTISSLGCGIANSLPVLIAFRIIQAIGGSMTSCISMALIFRLSSPETQGKAMGIMGATVAIASLAGPGLGGILIAMFDWRAIFLINVPIGIIALLIGVPYLRIKEIREKKSNIDWIGSVCFACAVTSLMIMFNSIATSGLYSITVLGAFAVTLLAFSIVIWNGKKHSNPILDVNIFREYLFSLPLLSMILFFASIFILNITMPFYLEEVMGYVTFKVGILMMVIPLVLVVGSPITGWLYDRSSWKHFASMGLLVAFTALLICSWAVMNQSISVLVAGMGLFAVGYALFQSPNNIETMRGLHMDKASIASSVANTGRYFGMALGSSFASVILSMQFVFMGFDGLVLSSGIALLVAALLSIIAVLPSYMRNR